MRCGAGQYSFECFRFFPFIGHAVRNFRTDGDGIRIVVVSGNEHSVSSAGYGQGLDGFVGDVQLVLESVPAGSCRSFESDFMDVVCRGSLSLERGLEDLKATVPAQVLWAPMTACPLSL